MKFLSLIFVLTTNVFAGNFYFYANDLNQLQTELSKAGIKSSLVYSPEEMIILKKLGKKTNALKAETTLKKIKQLDLKNIKIEEEKKLLSFQQTQDEFIDRQWALFNRGEDLFIPISDIDYRKIPGVLGEDIQIKNLPAEKGQKIRVAIIDSGLDLEHPDLIGQIYTNKAECEVQRKYDQCLRDDPSNKECHKKFANIDSDGNGYPRDCHGWNIAAKQSEHIKVRGNNKIDDLIGHGTHIAGIIGAKANEIGIQGVLQNVEILPVKVNGEVNGDDNLGIDIFAKGILYAISTGAQVINLSVGWQFQEDSQLVREMVQLAHSRGIIVVSAAGNSSHDARSYPCAYEEVICVAAHTVNGKLASFTTYGAHVDLAAPGEEILSTWPRRKRSIYFVEREGYELLGGSSFAAPYVTASVAKLLNYGFNNREATQKILLGSRDQGELNLRYGKLDLFKAYHYKATSHIVPLTKKLNLVDWRKSSKTLKVQFTNRGSKENQVQVTFKADDSIRFEQSQFFFDTFKKDSVNELNLNFEVLNTDIEPFITIHAEVKQGSTVIDYPIVLEFVNPLTSKELSAIARPFKIESEVRFPWDKFLLLGNFFPIKESSGDQLMVVERKGDTYWSVLKSKKNTFQFDKAPMKLKGIGYIFAKNYFIDLNGDGKKEYVFLVYKQDKKDLLVSFKILSEDLKEVSAKDFGLEVPEEVLVRSRFEWHKVDKGMIPVWIQDSKNPEVKEPENSWDLPEVNELKPRLLYIADNKIKTIDLDYTPHHFVKGSLDRLIVLSSQGKGGLKRFNKVVLTDKTVAKNSNIVSGDYFSFDQARISGFSGNENIFVLLTDSSVNYVSLENSSKVTKIKKEKNSFKRLYPVLGFSSGNYLSYLSGDSLVISNGKNQTKINKRSDQRRDPNYYILKTKSPDRFKFYRNSSETLGLSLDLITAEERGGEVHLSRRAREAYVMGEKCSEMAVEKDSLLFFCADTLSIYRLKMD